MKGIFLENIKFVFLSNKICKNPKVVDIGAKKNNIIETKKLYQNKVK